MSELGKVIISHLQSVWNLQQCFLSNSFSLERCVLQTDSLDVSLWFMIIVIIYSFVWSIVGNNCSKVDQIWSIVPWIYVWIFFFHYFYQSQIIHLRLLLLAILTTLWGIRLTYNFWRRGGYGTFFVHEEDYRWPIIRSKMNPFIFLIFNLTFIATYQNVLLWLIASPAYIVAQSNPTVIHFPDLLLAFIFISLLIFETVADQQQYNFQQYKHSLTLDERKNHQSESIRNGFLRKGLFQYCRHPNYFAEQAIWVCVYCFSVLSDSISLVNWTISGCLLLILLFQGSTAFSESITAEKYPAYRIYQKEVSQTIPWFSRRQKGD
jgi:steroid 5-alpha reductase family enzyme